MNKKKDKKERKFKKGKLFGFLKKPKKVKEQPSIQQEEDSLLDDSINLIPEPTKEEINEEQRKAKLSVGSAFSLLTLVIISVFIISFNIFSKIELNAKRESLYEYETTLKRNSQEIIDNNDIVDRIFLYKDIEEQTFSPRQVIEYVEEIAEKSGGINIEAYDISDGLDFEFSGDSQDLEKVSKFWYLLCNDDSIETVNLDSISKTNTGSTFSFSGQLKYEKFLNSSNEDN